MKKVILSATVALFLFIFIVPLFLPKTFQVEESTGIKAPVKMVFDRVANLHTWKDWSPWYAEEPTAEFEASGTPGVVGSQLTWKGQKIGKGTQTLVSLENNISLYFELEFEEPQSSPAQTHWLFVDSDGTTTVTWRIEGPLTYPVERLFGLFLPKMLQKNFSRGLSSLRELLEKP